MKSATPFQKIGLQMEAVLILSKRCLQKSKQFFVLDGRLSELVDSSEKIVHSFKGNIDTVLDLPDGGTVVLVRSGPEGGRNIFAFNSDGTLRWRNADRKIRKTGEAFDGSREAEPAEFGTIYFESGSGETRRRDNVYFEGAILATRAAWGDLYSVDFNTGEVTFVRNTGSHDED